MEKTFNISKLYEESLDVNVKKSKGIYYTPKIIVDYILNKTIKNISNNNIIELFNYVTKSIKINYKDYKILINK